MKNQSQAESLLKHKWIQIFNKLEYFDISGALKYTSSPEKFAELSKNSTYIEDEIFINVLHSILSPYFRVHIGKHTYFPRLTSYTCFRPDFPFITEANKM